MALQSQNCGHSLRDVPLEVEPPKDLAIIRCGGGIEGDALSVYFPIQQYTIIAYQIYLNRQETSSTVAYLNATDDYKLTISTCRSSQQTPSMQAVRNYHYLVCTQPIESPKCRIHDKLTVRHNAPALNSASDNLRCCSGQDINDFASLPLTYLPSQGYHSVTPTRFPFLRAKLYK